MFYRFSIAGLNRVEVVFSEGKNYVGELSRLCKEVVGRILRGKIRFFRCMSIQSVWEQFTAIEPVETLSDEALVLVAVKQPVLVDNVLQELMTRKSVGLVDLIEQVPASRKVLPELSKDSMVLYRILLLAPRGGRTLSCRAM